MYCRAPTRPYSFFGDGGALLSIGLLQNISFVDIEKCIARQWSTGGASQHIRLFHLPDRSHRDIIHAHETELQQQCLHSLRHSPLRQVSWCQVQVQMHS